MIEYKRNFGLYVLLALLLAFFAFLGSGCSADPPATTAATVPATEASEAILPTTSLIPSEESASAADSSAAPTESEAQTTETEAQTTETTTLPPKTTTSAPPETTEAPLPPEILLLGDSDMELRDDELFLEPGFSAWDAQGNSLTQQVELEIDALPGAPHCYQYRYTVSDAAGLTAEAYRVIRWQDTHPPELILLGDAHMTLEYNQDFRDPGARATDVFDGDLSDIIQVEGSVDPHQTGRYTLTYSVTDAQGNTASLSRTVVVKEAPPPTTAAPPETTAAPPATQPATQPAPGGSRIVYLTFDDGPFIYTERLLNILARYNVKATFFVTAFSPEHAYLIGRTASEGHTIGLHTASHRYNEIYQSEEAYFRDLSIIADLYRRQTGQEPWLIRFPGGSSNTVSREYNAGIMTRLTRAVQERGYRYMDWNVSSSDSATWMSPDTVFQNVIRGISGRDMSVVLMHDLKEHTVNAIESIIQWCQSNGYTLLPITPSTPDVHHNVQN